MTSYIVFLQEHIGLPGVIATGVVAVFFVVQVVGELLEFKGKVVPEIFKIRKIFQRRKAEKQETQKTIQEVKQLLNEINKHYSEDNITKRNSWMKHVDDRIAAYAKSIVGIQANMTGVADALKANTHMTEEMFVQNSRDRILDFAARVASETTIVSREEFKRIFGVIDEYENFIEAHNLTNGETKIAHRTINEAYEMRLKNASFMEDVRGYNC